MLAYFCATCQFYYREAELLTGKGCPECKNTTKPRMVLNGQVLAMPKRGCPRCGSVCGYNDCAICEKGKLCTPCARIDDMP